MSAALDAEARRLLARLPQLMPAGSAPAQLVMVCATSGSAPRAIGARLLCRSGQLLDGTIGGGRLEARAIERAATLAAQAHDGMFEPQVERFALGPELAQCCGGVVELMFRPLDASGSVLLAQELATALATGGQLRTSCDGHTLVEQAGPGPTVLICGAGHVGTAVARTLTVLPWRTVVMDERPQWADPQRLPQEVQVICARPLHVLSAWGWLGATAQATDMARRLADRLPTAPTPAATAALVMTHEHELDGDLVDALLRLPERLPGEELRHVGLIGSRTKINSLRSRLRGRGLADERLSRLSAPIGLHVDGRLLGGKMPGEIAISVAAELLTVMRPQVEP